MYTGRNYPIIQTLSWSRKYLIVFLLTGLIPVLLRLLMPKYPVFLPWLPVSLIGIAVAFYLGFKNNASYDRLWEARKIWGGIVNDSRTWGMMVKGYVRNNFDKDEEVQKLHRRLIFRHLAWLHALRFQLRANRPWEHVVKEAESLHYPKTEERTKDKNDILSDYLSNQEWERVLTKGNTATQILDLQMEDLTSLRKKGLIEDFRHMELGNILRSFYELQGKSERIKNFPFPRQYASLNIYFVWIFIILLPFGLVQEFAKIGDVYIWFSIPFSILISWVFHTMERIGDFSENPFEGLNNDVPITALSRTIEIDLLEMLDEVHVPAPLKPEHHILM